MSPSKSHVLLRQRPTPTEVVAWLRTLPEDAKLTLPERFEVYLASGQVSEYDRESFKGLGDKPLTFAAVGKITAADWADEIENYHAHRVTRALTGKD